MTGVVAGIAAEGVKSVWTGLKDWYYQRELVRAYGPTAAAVIGGIALLNFDQTIRIGTLCVKLVKTLKSGSATVSVQPGTQTLFEFKSGEKPARDIPWKLIGFILSVISLRHSRVGGQQVRLLGRAVTLPSIPTRALGAVFLTLMAVKKALEILWFQNKSPIGAVWATKFISKTLQAGPLSSSQQREVFRNTPMTRTGPVPNHSHGGSAADRNASCATSVLASQALGLEPYLVQQSLSDVRKGRKGDRSFHWAKDIAVPPKEFNFDPKSQAAILVDVDYYIDMPHLLAKYPGTYFVCAVQPTAAAKSEGEYTFRFLEGDRLHYRVSGGAEYTHEIWDYSGDTLLVEDVGFTSKRMVAYHVDRKHVDAHHVVIMLSVIGVFDALSILPTSYLLEGKRLERFRPVRKDHVVLDVVSSDGLSRSVACVGSHNAVTLPKSQFDAVEAVAMVAKMPITPGMVASNIAPSSATGLPTEKLPPGHAAIVAGFVRAGMPHFPPVVYPPQESFVPIWFAKHDYDAPVPLAGFGSPLMGPCFGFADSIAADERCIEGRVKAFLDRPRIPLPPKYVGFMSEFMEFLIPENMKHTGDPVDHDEVREKQDSPSQRAILEEAAVTGDSWSAKWSVFKKKETYQKPTDPRNISQSVPIVKETYSRYMYAFDREIMKSQPWYAFNKTPAEVAQRVCDVFVDAPHSVMCDGSRFDGHVELNSRILERMCMLRFFRPCHHSGVNEAMDDQIALPGTTEHQFKYHSGYSRGSGSLETANFNSIITAFIDYCALRQTTVNGVVLSPAQAWRRLGIYGGDDSLSWAVDPEMVKKASAVMGQDYEVEVVARGDLGVNFLNRQFGPDVWNGDVNSMANPARLLSKLWVGPSRFKPYSGQALERFAERISGYYRMDRNSPVIGAICRVSHDLLGERMEGELMPWDGKHSLEANWPNEDSGWMGDVFQRFVPDFDFERFEGWIASIWETRDPQLLLRAPLCTPAGLLPVVVKIASVVGDELVLPVPKDDKGKEELDEIVPTPLPPSTEAAVDTPKCEPSLESGSTSYTGSAVAVAEAFVPKVDSQGRRVVEKQAQAAPAEPKQPAKAHTDPREWVVPKQRTNETKEVFQARLKQWEKKRREVAKRLGVALPK